jgi:hypothetical protein
VTDDIDRRFAAAIVRQELARTVPLVTRDAGTAAHLQHDMASGTPASRI